MGAPVQSAPARLTPPQLELLVRIVDDKGGVLSQGFAWADALAAFILTVPQYTGSALEPTKSELRTIERGRREFAEGKYTEWSNLKHELAHSRKQSRKKAA
jgi:hypothetical protein